MKYLKRKMTKNFQKRPQIERSSYLRRRKQKTNKTQKTKKTPKNQPLLDIVQQN